MAKDKYGREEKEAKGSLFLYRLDYLVRGTDEVGEQKKYKIFEATTNSIDGMVEAFLKGNPRRAMIELFKLGAVCLYGLVFCIPIIIHLLAIGGYYVFA